VNSSIGRKSDVEGISCTIEVFDCSIIARA
jgi:hypothetical protein